MAAQIPKKAIKLLIQIPCLNEEATLPAVLRDIPEKIDGVDEIIVLVIDDGSTDNTVQVAKRLGVTHFVHHTRNMGLGESFRDGVTYALQIGADILVNTDGDNQFPQQDIARLVRPILDGKADIVVADRGVATVEHYSAVKKVLQSLGTKVVNFAAGVRLPDAASGFRAYSRESLYKLNTTTYFSYCMETIIQAGNKRMAIASVPITMNPKTRESRLFKSMHEHVIKSGITIIRSYIMYRPYALFLSMGALLFLLGLAPFFRYIYLFVTTTRSGHLQSLIVGTTLMTGSFLSVVLGVLADLTRINRILVENQLELAKRALYNPIKKP